MNNRRNLIWYCGAPLVAVGCLLMMLLDSGGDTIWGGYFLGTAFGQITLAAAWTTFGPLKLAWRFLLSLLWLMLVIAALGWNIWMSGTPNEFIAAIAGCLFGQFLLLQIPLWGLVMACGLRLRQNDRPGQAPDPKEMQFGIRELLIFTTLVAVLLGIGRVAIDLAPIESTSNVQFGFVFAFLAIAAMIMAVPLLLAALLPRFAIPAVLFIIILIGLATTGESPLLAKFQSNVSVSSMGFISINTFTAAWVLAVAMILRLSGYRLARELRG